MLLFERIKMFYNYLHGNIIIFFIPLEFINIKINKYLYNGFIYVFILSEEIIPKIKN